MCKNHIKIAVMALSCAAISSCTPSMINSALSSQPAAATPTQTAPTSQSAGSNNVASLITNLIASVAGDVTTNKNTLVGTWTYNSPCVQFESKNLLTQAGGSAAAIKVEEKLNSYYQMVGIKPGKMVFTFATDGSVTYKVGSMTRKGTYTFDAASKTLTITTASGQNIKAYVTVTGNVMALTFEANKLLSLMTSVGSKFQQLQTISTLAAAYDGMKLGFKFSK